MKVGGELRTDREYGGLIRPEPLIAAMLDEESIVTQTV